jgi:hypothetical protein
MLRLDPIDDPIATKLTVDQVTLGDGLDEREAAILSSEYLRRFVGGGMPDKPKDDGRYWRVRLWAGVIGTYQGTLQLAKDGSEVLLVSPRGGFKSMTRELLKRGNVKYE